MRTCDRPFDELALVLDIETVAIPDASAYLGPAQAPSHYQFWPMRRPKMRIALVSA